MHYTPKTIQIWVGGGKFLNILFQKFHFVLFDTISMCVVNNVVKYHLNAFLCGVFQGYGTNNWLHLLQFLWLLQ